MRPQHHDVAVGTDVELRGVVQAGVALVKGGLPVGWAIAMSASVYAASAQLATLPMVSSAAGSAGAG